MQKESKIMNSSYVSLNISMLSISPKKIMENWICFKNGILHEETLLWQIYIEWS